ncbi:polyamine aminopropyltransferase [Inmirania thermothiophila]|uniref:Polyamine aminopropyltransferase n=1 Tax=Inmirania thermothiophila TaxID=1750597 RepID=A0A3N1Y6D5_9GAMM|nr:polyamine aminopropyltransferase [Inmirania thermothiophila]ROR34310.1 spermidine synthase [Inmirania thermothiophila]
MTLDGQWFTERCKEGGSAFSLKVRAKLHEEQTPYQRIEIYDTEAFGHLMVIDGFVMLTARDNFVYHEMMAHPVLYTHEAPRRVLVIGGGDCGTLREVLRHPEVERVVQVEIDERVTRLAERYFPELTEANGDPRAELVFADGIRWVAEAPEASLDVIIVDSTDPIGPAEGLFNEPFYRDCLRVLGEGGLLVQQSESPLYHQRILTAMRRAMRAAGFADLATLHFPQPTYPSGWWSATMARKGRPIDGFREADAAARPFPTRYYTPGTHRGALALPPFLAAALEGT